MKILLVGFSKIKYMPYSKFYLNQMDTKEHEIHFIYWNRDQQVENHVSNIIYHEFSVRMQDDVSKLKKMKPFLAYKKYAQNVLSNWGPFDLIVLMHTIPAVLLGNSIYKQLKVPYIFDYRDYTYENHFLYRIVVSKVVKHAKANFVSSNGFRKALPKTSNIYTSHNILTEDFAHRFLREKQEKTPIKIGFWGFIRHEKVNIEVIDAFANDNRFELHYYGREQDVACHLKEYVAQKKIKNVSFHGEYNPEERYDIVKNVDMVHNVYSNTEAPSQRYAMSNKFYDGILFYLPQLCTVGSYMAEQVKKKALGVLFDPKDKQFADSVYEYYTNLSMTEFRQNCDSALKQIMEEYKKGICVINDILTKN